MTNSIAGDGLPFNLLSNFLGPALLAVFAIAINTGNAQAQTQVHSAVATNVPPMPTIWPTLLALAAVIATIVIFGWLMKKLNPNSAKSGHLLHAVSQISVGQKERIVVVAFQSQWLVLGVTPQSIQLLTTTIAPAVDTATLPDTVSIPADTLPKAPFAHWLNAALGRKPAGVDQLVSSAGKSQ